MLELSKPEEVIYEAIGHCYDRMRNYAQARFHYRKASHLNPDDSKLFYKIACTYYNEGQWTSTIKQLESALKIHRQQFEYNLLMGEAKFQLTHIKEAIQYFSDKGDEYKLDLLGNLTDGEITFLYTRKFY